MIGLTMIIIIGAGFHFAVQYARQTVRNDAQSAVHLALELIRVGLPPGTQSTVDLHQWMNQVGRLEKIRHLNLSIINPTAPVISPMPENQGHQASVPGWYRWGVAPEPIIVERTFGQGQLQPFTIRIAASGDDEIKEAWIETRAFLVLLLTLAGAIYGIVHIIVGQAFKPVGTILDGLKRLESGDFDTRLPHFSLPELDRLSGSINRLAMALGVSREQNQALTRHSLAIQEEERRALAQELHDEFGQCLTAIKLMGSTLKKSSDPPGSAAEQIVGLCDRLFEAVRSMMRRLRPMILEDLGLHASLEDLVAQWKAMHPEIALHLDCESGADRLTGDLALQIYRITQEGLTNMVKHSGAAKGWIQLRMTTANCVALTIGDDGRGMPQNQPQGGFGLPGIRERVTSLGGDFDLYSPPAGGLVMRVTIPCTQP